MNIFVREIIVGFPNYVCIPHARVACDLELKFWVTLCVLDFNIFAAWWFAVLEFDKISECFPQKKKSVQKHKCMPSIHGLQLRASALVIYIISPAWVDILNLEKWFTMNTLIQSNKEVWAFVSSCSFLPPGSSTSSGRLLSGRPPQFLLPCIPKTLLHLLGILPTSFFSALLAATYYSKTSTPTCPHL